MMEKNKKKGYNLGLILGILGFLAGVYLVIEGDYVIGIAGGIASAGLAVMNYKAKKPN